MGRTNGHPARAADQAELPLFTPPTIFVPPVSIRQPDGSILIKAGKPVIVENMVGTREAARILGMSQRWVITECSLGAFKTAYQPGGRRHASWKIARSEVLDRMQNRSLE